MHTDTDSKFATSINNTSDQLQPLVDDTGGAFLAANIFAIFRKNSKWRK